MTAPARLKARPWFAAAAEVAAAGNKAPLVATLGLLQLAVANMKPPAGAAAQRPAVMEALTSSAGSAQNGRRGAATLLVGSP
jgi:hypothetical protein